MVNRSGIIAATRAVGSAVALVVALALVLALAGCASNGPSAGPIDWWHQLEGGLIARNRPPPPGEFDPYPKIGTVPARPEIPSVASRQALYDQLLAERERTERIAARDPVPAPSAAAPAQKSAEKSAPKTATAQPGPAGAAAPAAPDAGVSNATFAAAGPATPPAVAPHVTPTAPVIAPSVVTQGPDGKTIELPPVYETPPAPARFEGVAALPSPSPDPPVPDFVPTAQRGTQVDFLPGQAVLGRDAPGVLQALASKRGAAPIAVTGYGDAASDAPEAQAASLRLALSRAQAVATRLQADGVPGSALRINAEAFGRGAAVRLLQ